MIRRLKHRGVCRRVRRRRACRDNIENVSAKLSVVVFVTSKASSFASRRSLRLELGHRVARSFRKAIVWSHCSMCFASPWPDGLVFAEISQCCAERGCAFTRR